LSQEDFQRSIRLEGKRAERSGKPFLLVLLHIYGPAPRPSDPKLLAKIMNSLTLATRDTDLTGWYQQDSVVGILFTEMGMHLTKSLLATIILRVSGAMRRRLSLEQFSQVAITFRLFPEDEAPGSLPADEPFPSVARFAI